MVLVAYPRVAMSLNSFSSRSVDVRSTNSLPMTGSTLVPSSWRALATVFGDFTRAWRDFAVGDTFGHPALNQSLMTSSNVARAPREPVRSCGASHPGTGPTPSIAQRWGSSAPWVGGPSASLPDVANEQMATCKWLRRVKVRYPCSVLAPVGVFHVGEG